MGWDGIHAPPYKSRRPWPGHCTLECAVPGRVPRSRPKAGRCKFGFFWSVLLPHVPVAACDGLGVCVYPRLNPNEFCWYKRRLGGMFGVGADASVPAHACVQAAFLFPEGAARSP